MYINKIRNDGWLVSDQLQFLHFGKLGDKNAFFKWCKAKNRLMKNDHALKDLSVKNMLSK